MAQARKPAKPAAMQPGKSQDGGTAPVQTEGARHPARPATQTATQRAGKSGDGLPPFETPQSAAPEPGPRPTATAPLPDHTRPRTHAERNA